MANEFRKKIYVHDISVHADIDISLGDYTDFYNVTISCEATGLDNTDATVGFLERTDSTCAWKLLPGMTYAFAAMPDDSQELTHGDFGSKFVGLQIKKGSCTTGVITVWVIARED